MKTFKANRGFTLVELLVVIAVLGVLMAFAIPGILSISNKMKGRGLDSKIESIEEAAVIYAQENSNKIKSKILKEHPGASNCKENQTNSDGSYWCWCDPNSKDIDGNKNPYDCKFVFTITVDELIREGYYKSETPKDDSACDVPETNGSSNCLDCVPITVKLDDDHKNATAELDKEKIGTAKSCS